MTDDNRTVEMVRAARIHMRADGWEVSIRADILDRVLPPLPAATSPSPPVEVAGGWREKCDINKAADDEYRVYSPDGCYVLGNGGPWWIIADAPAGYGRFYSRNGARAALAAAPPPPGVVAPPPASKPEQVRCAWSGCDAIKPAGNPYDGWMCEKHYRETVIEKHRGWPSGKLITKAPPALAAQPFDAAKFAYQYVGPGGLCSQKVAEHMVAAAHAHGHASGSASNAGARPRRWPDDKPEPGTAEVMCWWPYGKEYLRTPAEHLSDGDWWCPMLPAPTSEGTVQP